MLRLCLLQSTVYFCEIRSFTVYAMLYTRQFQSKKLIPAIRTLMLFLAGQAEQLVPPHMMRLLYEKAHSAATKRFVAFPTGTHNDTWMCVPLSFYYELHLQVRTRNFASRARFAYTSTSVYIYCTYNCTSM